MHFPKIVMAGHVPCIGQWDPVFEAKAAYDAEREDLKGP